MGSGRPELYRSPAELSLMFLKDPWRSGGGNNKLCKKKESSEKGAE
jgi:hypothetical protein